MTKIEYYCDCCGRKVGGDNCLNPIKLPNWHSARRVEDSRKNFYMKDYDFCDDCYKAFAEMMYMSEEESTVNPLFNSVCSFKNALEKRE